MIRKLLAAFIISGVIVLSFFQFYQFLKKRIASSDLKKVTERRISAFLKVPVQVDRISVGLLKHISLSGLKIEQTQKGYPLLIGVKKIDVRYDLLSVVKRNFKIPAEVFLDAPRLTLKAFQSPGTVFETNIIKSERGILTRFEFEDGEIQMPWFGSDSIISLNKIEGKAVPKKGDLFDVRFKAQMAGGLQGAVLAYGEVDPVRKTYRMEIMLEDVHSVKSSRVPLTHLKGTIEVQNNSIRIQKMNFLIRGIPVEISGRIQHIFSSAPVFNLSVRIKEGASTLASQWDLNFEKKTVDGFIKYFDQTHRFSGDIDGLPMDFKINRLVVDKVYQGAGQFDVQKNIYWLELLYGKQRFRIDLSVHGLAGRLRFKLDHLDLAGFDLVTLATMDLKPYQPEWGKGNHIFEAEIKTEYLIVQFQPLRDFQAEAKLSLRGFHDIRAKWGNVCELDGEILFGHVSDVQMNLKLDPLHLEEFRYLGVYPLPLSLAGTLEGKANVRGPMDHLFLDGTFGIANGEVGSLAYDHAVINFSGHFPYFILKDSKVYKGKNTFGLKGAFDFGLHNFMKGVYVNNSEHVVIWRGLELNSELESAGSDFEPLGKVKAEYHLGERTSINMTAEKDQTNDDYLAIGPKLKF